MGDDVLGPMNRPTRVKTRGRRVLLTKSAGTTLPIPQLDELLSMDRAHWYVHPKPYLTETASGATGLYDLGAEIEGSKQAIADAQEQCQNLRDRVHDQYLKWLLSSEADWQAALLPSCGQAHNKRRKRHGSSKSELFFLHEVLEAADSYTKRVEINHRLAMQEQVRSTSATTCAADEAESLLNLTQPQTSPVEHRPADELHVIDAKSLDCPAVVHAVEQASTSGSVAFCNAEHEAEQHRHDVLRAEDQPYSETSSERGHAGEICSPHGLQLCVCENVLPESMQVRFSPVPPGCTGNTEGAPRVFGPDALLLKLKADPWQNLGLSGSLTLAVACAVFERCIPLTGPYANLLRSVQGVLVPNLYTGTKIPGLLGKQWGGMASVVQQYLLCTPMFSANAEVTEVNAGLSDEVERVRVYMKLWGWTIWRNVLRGMRRYTHFLEGIDTIVRRKAEADRKKATFMQWRVHSATLKRNRILSNVCDLLTKAVAGVNNPPADSLQASLVEQGHPETLHRPSAHIGTSRSPSCAGGDIAPFTAAKDSPAAGKEDTLKLSSPHIFSDSIQTSRKSVVSFSSAAGQPESLPRQVSAPSDPSAQNLLTLLPEAADTSPSESALSTACRNSEHSCCEAAAQRASEVIASQAFQLHQLKGDLVKSASLVGDLAERMAKLTRKVKQNENKALEAIARQTTAESRLQEALAEIRALREKQVVGPPLSSA